MPKFALTATTTLGDALDHLKTLTDTTRKGDGGRTVRYSAARIASLRSFLKTSVVQAWDVLYRQQDDDPRRLTLADVWPRLLDAPQREIETAES